MPVSWAGPNRLASRAAVRLGATGASISSALPASARTRSIPARQSCPTSCAVATHQQLTTAQTAVALLDRPDPSVEDLHQAQPGDQLLDRSQSRQPSQGLVRLTDPDTSCATLPGTFIPS